MADYQFNTNLGPAAQQGTNIADMVNLARGVQAYQQAQELNPLAAEKARIELEQLKKTNPLLLRQQAAQTETAEIGTQKAQTELGGQKMQKFMDTVGARVTDQQMLDAVKSKNAAKVKDLISGDIQELINHKVLSPAEAMQAGARMLDLADKDINAVVPALQNLVTRAASPESRLGLQTGQVTTNAAGQLVNVKPVLNRINVLGEPTVPTGVTPQSMGMPQGAPMSANPSQAQVGLLNKATETSAADWANTVADANTSQGRIAIYQNIKSLTPDAFTGVGGERKKFLSGLAQSIGIPAYELETSTTDELTKNAKLLSLAGGNTDAARSIAEMATPNAKMTKEAIERVANQLIGVEKLKQAKADYLAPYLTNPAQYQQKLNEFQKFSDFRLFQEMSPDEVAKLKASMSPAERKAMSEKIREARTLGIIR